MNHRDMAIIVAIPSALCAIASCILAPWMIEVLGRLDNTYWEIQVVAGISALVLVSLTFPALIFVIVTQTKRYACHVWTSTVIAYLVMAAYVIQSHLPIALRAGIATLCVACAALGYIILSNRAAH